MLRDKLKLFLVVIGLFIGSLPAHSQDIKGSWQNELGSIFVIDSISSDGFIFGKYKSSSGVDGRIFPLQGWVNNLDNANKNEKHSIAVAFTVRWDGYGSITSWSGYYDEDQNGPFIKTLWHLVRPNEKEAWERIITNSSTFRPFQE